MQSKRLAGLFVMVCALALSGCARLEFYTDQNLQGPETGAKFYTAKPYLLVVQGEIITNGSTNQSGTQGNQSQKKTSTCNTQQPAVTQGDGSGSGKAQVQVSIVYLPDLKKPCYAKLKSGYGSATLSLAFQNGMLTSVGQTTNTEVPETITALAGLVTSAAKIPSATKEMMLIKPATYSEISEHLKTIAAGLNTQYTMAKKCAQLANDELQILSSVVKKIQDASSLLFDPTKAADNLSEVQKSLQDSINALTPIAAPCAIPVRITIQQYISQLQDILQQLSPSQGVQAPTQPTVHLYEIDNSGDPTKLKEVPFPMDAF